MLIGELALIAAALFAGAAIYVSVAEHPARRGAGDEAALVQWKSSYARAKIMQATLALVGGAFAFGLWWRSLNQLWLIGALLLLASWPYTLLVVMKVNRRLEAIAPGEAGPESRALLARWGRLHAVRSALGAAAVVVMLCALHWRA
jgi:hypothetical protein